jgi:hypothetical protein
MFNLIMPQKPNLAQLLWLSLAGRTKYIYFALDDFLHGTHDFLADQLSD